MAGSKFKAWYQAGAEVFAKTANASLVAATAMHFGVKLVAKFAPVARMAVPYVVGETVRGVNHLPQLAQKGWKNGWTYTSADFMASTLALIVTVGGGMFYAGFGGNEKAAQHIDPQLLAFLEAAMAAMVTSTIEQIPIVKKGATSLVGMFSRCRDRRLTSGHLLHSPATDDTSPFANSGGGQRSGSISSSRSNAQDHQPDQYGSTVIGIGVSSGAGITSSGSDLETSPRPRPGQRNSGGNGN